VGVLSEKDLMSIMLGPEWWAVPIKDVMKRNVVCYEESTPALAIYEFLARVVIRGVVIVKQGSPTGLITRGCLLRFFMNLLAARKTDGVFPEVDATASQLVERMGHVRVQDRIAKTVRTLAAESRDMELRLSDGDHDHDLVPLVVGGATRVQELVTDLLAISRYAQGGSDENADPALHLGTPMQSVQILGTTQFATNAVTSGEPAGETFGTIKSAL
jgi:hypothetical protein